MIIKIEAFSNGGHSNQSTDIFPIPDGWAYVPDDMEIPDTFPFVTIETDNKNNRPTVTKMTAGTIPIDNTPKQKTEIEKLQLAIAELGALMGGTT